MDSLQNFGQQTTVHGLHIFGIPKLHFLEKIFWIVMVTIAAFAAINIGYSNWKRYQANPTVVSIQKDFRNWENPFPAVTGCFVNKTDKVKAQKFIFQKWGILPENSKYNYYLNFVNTVTNISYDNLADFQPFVDDGAFDDVNMLELANQVHPNLSGTLVTFDTQHKSDWVLMMSEIGMCFSLNSQFVDLLTIKTGSQQNLGKKDKRILKCHYLNGLCYARYDSDPQLAVKYYIHSYQEVVHYTMDPPLIVKESEELEMNYRIQETTSVSKLYDLTPSQRGCRFYNEPLTIHLPVYSTSFCYMICRYKLALRLCGCKPFFYHMLEGKPCNVKGLLCLAKYVQEINKPPGKIGCNCPEPCNLLTYFPQIPKYTRWEYGYFEQRITFRWGLLPPTIKFRRDVLFGFEDLVVSFGGTVALFLGISFISVIETVFLIFEIVYNMYKKRFNGIVEVQPIRLK